MELLKIYFTSYLIEEEHEKNQQLPLQATRLQRIARKTSMALPQTPSVFSSGINKDPLLVCLGKESLTLEQVQNQLDSCNLTKLIVKIIERSPPHPVVLEAVKLAVALLTGGNKQVQVSNTLSVPFYPYSQSTSSVSLKNFCFPISLFFLFHNYECT